MPDQEPGDLVFVLIEIEHPKFTRKGSDLSAHIEITLAESLCGFSRVVLKHLDGRGLHVNHQQETGGVIKPKQVIKVIGEGMPFKRSDLRGDLYLIVEIKFPGDDWLRNEKTISQLRKLLPPPEKPIAAETVDEVEYDEDARIEDFGTSEGDQAWVDEDEFEGAGHGRHQAQCHQQ